MTRLWGMGSVIRGASDTLGQSSRDPSVFDDPVKNARRLREGSPVTVNTPATIERMPNQPKTKVSTFRIPLDLKAAAMAKAQANGTDLTAVIVAALERYVESK